MTGHLGYIGTAAVPMFQARGHEVVGLDTDLYRDCTFGPVFAPVTNTASESPRSLAPSRRGAAVRASAATGEASRRPRSRQAGRLVRVSQAGRPHAEQRRHSGPAEQLQAVGQEAVQVVPRASAFSTSTKSKSDRQWAR